MHSARAVSLHSRKLTLVTTGGDADVFRIALKKIRHNHADIFIFFLVAGADETEMLTTGY